ncbi:MAG: oxidase, partial [Ilumatobacteraceae bacterium]|nr:oxidase [Ilumatobacteraceae bacterium]
MNDFRHLLAPGTIGPMALRNRIVLPGMDMNHCDNGVMTSKEIEHYAARAEGGCALVTTGASAIAWPIGSASWHEAGLGDDRFLPGLARLADAVHAGGAKLSVQLVHHGKVAGVDTAEGRPLLVPSVPTGRMDMSALA